MEQSHIHELKTQQKKLHHVTEHLANERTILAWIRTAIAVITLGVGINRFSLFLVEFSHIVPDGKPINAHAAEELGIGLVALGLLVMVGGMIHYLHVADAIDAESYRPSRLGVVATASAVLLLGGASLAWMLWQS